MLWATEGLLALLLLTLLVRIAQAELSHRATMDKLAEILAMLQDRDTT